MITNILEFEYDKSSHILSTHFSKLGLKRLEDHPLIIEVIGITKTIVFKFREKQSDVVLYDPESEKIPQGPGYIGWENIVLVIRNWH